MWRWIVVAMLAFVACDDGAFEPSPGETCELGQQRGCQCDDGEAGAQMCLFAEPAEWGLCACNKAPIADAGGNISVPYQTYVKLDGTASWDPDSSNLLYKWEVTELPSGSAAILDDDAAARPSFFTDRQGPYVVRLVVGDGSKWSMPASVTVTAVQTSNEAPIADAGLNATIITGQPHVLDGSGSFDPNGDPISYSWVLTTTPIGSTAILVNSNTVAPAFTPDLDGTYVFKLVVSDGALTSSPDSITIETGPVPNTAPVANAGQNATATTGQVFVLDGSHSFDVDGDPLAYAWAITTRPVGSSAVLTNPTTVFPRFTPDVDGTYEIMLVVNDAVRSSTPDTVTITASTPPNHAPVAKAGQDASAANGQSVILDGSGSSDPDGNPLTYAWTITARPPNSAAVLVNPTTVKPTFTPDVNGTYELALVVSDGALASAPDSIVVLAVASTTLPYRPVDAEYSSALDRIIMVAAAPNTLQIYDPVATTSIAITLPTAPTSVSVSPNGLQAAVGHDGWVSIVDLQTATVTVTHPVTANAGDVVFAGNGFAYVFPKESQWVQIHCLQIATGTETLGGLVRERTRAKLHPGGMAIYGATNGLSPSDIEKYSLINDIAERAYDSPYHGEYSMCGNLWMTEDGQRIITTCGNVFNASTVQSQDMTYSGSLSDVGFMTHASHAPVPGKLLAIPQPSTTIRMYEYPFLNLDRQFILPKVGVLDDEFTNRGRFVFSNSTGTTYFVVVQADQAAGLVHDFAVVTYPF